MASSEQKGFVFAVSFIILFAGLLTTMPTGLQGTGGSGDEVIPLNPSLLTDFVAQESFNSTSFSPVLTLFVHDYSLDGRDWFCRTDNTTYFDLNAKNYFVGVWLGGYDIVKFTSSTDRGISLTFTELDEDIEDGIAYYALTYFANGNDAGDFIVYYNASLYSNSSAAWESGALFFLHGVGMTASTDVASLLLALLFFQLPDVPFLVNLLLATTLWASVIYVAWYIIKEMIPFL